MEKLRLADGTEMEISEGSDLRNITTGLKSYAELDGLAGKLTRENLTRVQFLTDEMLTGEYRDMELCTPEFTVVQKEGILLAGFGLQEIPAAEKQQEEIHMALSYLTDEEAATVRACIRNGSRIPVIRPGRGLHTRICCTVQDRTILRTDSIHRIPYRLYGI